MRTLRELFGQWVRVSPDDPQAHAMLAELLERAGEIVAATPGQTSALTAIRSARALTTDSVRRLALASDEVRLLLKSEDFKRAAHLADSLLDAHPDPDVRKADILLGLAALTGQLERTGELMRALSLTTRAPAWSDGQSMPVPPQVSQQLAGVRAAALLGVCDDSVRSLPQWLDRSLASHYPDDAERRRVLDELTWRPLSQATPCLGLSAVTRARANDRLLQLQQTLAARGPGALSAGFDSLQSARRGLRPGDVSVDYTYHEAWLLAEAGDTARAVEHLDRTLSALPTLGSFLVSQPSEAAGLVRAMVLRARLALGTGDEAAARRWATSGATIWQSADSTVREQIDRLQPPLRGAPR